TTPSCATWRNVLLPPIGCAGREDHAGEGVFPWAVAVASGEGRAFSQLDRRSKLSDKKAPLFTLLCFFDKVKLMLRFPLTHWLSTTERKEVTRNDESIVHLAHPLPHPKYLPRYR